MILLALKWAILLTLLLLLGDFLVYKLGKSSREQKRLNKEAIHQMNEIHEKYLSNNKEN